MLDSIRSLPAKANLRHLKTQARVLSKALESGDREAAKRFKECLPKLSDISIDKILSMELGRQESQMVLAREYGFKTWTELKEYVDLQDLQRNNPAGIDPQYIRKVQYRDGSNLNTRIAFHRRFSPKGSSRSKLLLNLPNFEKSSRVLEAGCGSGNFWSKQWAHFPEGMSLTLMDTSPSLLESAACALEDTRLKVNAAQGDVAKMEFADESFDWVNCCYVLHCLPHQLAEAVLEIKRVLASDGIATITNFSKGNMITIVEMMDRLSPGLGAADSLANECVEEPVIQMARTCFKSVEIAPIESVMKVDDASAIVEYAKSYSHAQSADLPDEFWAELELSFQDEIDRIGFFAVHKFQKILKCMK